MELSTLFVHFQNKNGLFSIATESNLDSIYNFLKTNNVKCQQYVDECESNIIDLVDDIAAEEPVNIVFYVDYSNFRISKIVSNEIKKNYEDIKIIWIGEAVKENYKSILECFDVDICVIEDYENNILNIAKGCELSELKSVFYSNMLDAKIGDNKSYIHSSNIPSDNINSFVKKEDKDIYFNSMINGVKAKVTGLYPEQVISNVSKHIFCEGFHLDEEDYENLKGYTSINSAVINSENVNDLSGDYYKNIENASKNNYYLSHYHQIAKDQDDRTYIKFDDYSETVEIVKENYSDIEKLNNDEILNYDNSKISYLAIRTKEDFEMFCRDVEYFEKTGKFKRNSAFYLLEDACRWRESGACTAKNLVRFNLDSDRNIKPCNGCSKSIGNINDDFLLNVRNMYKISDKEHIVRKCTDCEAKDLCSKCVMLPDFLSHKEYCEFRRKHLSLTDYFTRKCILNFLANSSKIFKDIDIDNVEFSCKYRTKIIDNNLENQNYSHVERNIFLMYINGQPILFELFNNKLLKVSNEIAAVIECVYRGLQLEDIKKEYSKVFNIKDISQSDIVNKIVDMLVSKGYIKVKK